MIRYKRKSQRSGVILIAVLVCLGVATTILFTLIQSSVGVRRQVRQDLQMEQTKWLVDAGIRHAVVRLGGKEEFRGETMRLDDSLGDYQRAGIKITISNSELGDGVIRIAVTADLAGQGEFPFETKRSNEIVVSRSDINQSTE